MPKLAANVSMMFTEIDFMDRFGESAVRQHNHKLIREGVDLLAALWGFRVTTPDTMTASMALVPETVHTEGVSEPKLTVRPEVADALSVSGLPCT